MAVAVLLLPWKKTEASNSDVSAFQVKKKKKKCAKIRKSRLRCGISVGISGKTVTEMDSPRKEAPVRTAPPSPLRRGALEPEGSGFSLLRSGTFSLFRTDKSTTAHSHMPQIDAQVTASPRVCHVSGDPHRSLTAGLSDLWQGSLHADCAARRRWTERLLPEVVLVRGRGFRWPRPATAGTRGQIDAKANLTY